MIQNLYSIKDVKVCFDIPFQQFSDQVAVRTCQNMVNSDQDNALKQFTEDKELWKLGTFDTETGAIVSKPELVVRLVNLKKVGE